MRGPRWTGGWNGKRIALAVGLVVLLLLTAVLVANRDRLTFSYLSRSFQYRNLGTASHAEEFRFTNLTSNAFTILGNGLAVAAVDGLTVYNRAGEQVYAAVFPMEHPVVESAGDFVLAYDIGGFDIQLGNTREPIWHEGQNGHRELGRLIDARVNQ
ncbi:MAG: DUF5711 family protein, partial [Oscillospiraceae bacterium]|nr:DUF5711 family protein [Oscillospiraceae bacterium]